MTFLMGRCDPSWPMTSIEFIGSPDDRPGIRFSRATAKSPP
jgi:hypothetical protein